MTSQGTSVRCLTDFNVFPKLPKELRIMIWKRALPGPRIVELEHHQNDPDDGGFIMQEYFSSSCPIPVILSVCQESRSEAQSQYELSFPTVCSEPKVYFNPSTDTLVLSWRGALTDAIIPIVRSDTFDKVEHICFASWKLEYALGHLENLDHINAYPSIMTITIATDIHSSNMRLSQVSIEEDEFTMDEQSLCAAKIEDFLKKFVERHPNRKAPTVLVRSIKRHSSR